MSLQTFIEELPRTQYARTGPVALEAEDKEENSEVLPKEMVIESRFGSITAELEHAVFFPQGLLGLPQNLHFVLTDIPRPNMGQFKLLQCLNDQSLSFVVLPIDLENKWIAKDDLEECCDTLSVPKENLLSLVIVSVQRTPEAVKITGNCRAPIVVDVKDRMGIQYVFPHNKYDICQLLA